MDLPRLHKILIAAARDSAPAETVPYAFEQRMLARLRPRWPVNPWAVWSRGLGRAAACSVAAAFFLGFSTQPGPEAGADSFSWDLDQAMFASVDGFAGDTSADLW